MIFFFFLDFEKDRYWEEEHLTKRTHISSITGQYEKQKHLVFYFFSF